MILYELDILDINWIEWDMEMNLVFSLTFLTDIIRWELVTVCNSIALSYNWHIAFFNPFLKSFFTMNINLQSIVKTNPASKQNYVLVKKKGPSLYSGLGK